MNIVPPGSSPPEFQTLAPRSMKHGSYHLIRLRAKCRFPRLILFFRPRHRPLPLLLNEADNFYRSPSFCERASDTPAPSPVHCSLSLKGQCQNIFLLHISSGTPARFPPCREECRHSGKGSCLRANHDSFRFAWLFRSLYRFSRAEETAHVSFPVHHQI